jgi:hypothetical protein
MLRARYRRQFGVALSKAQIPVGSGAGAAVQAVRHHLRPHAQLPLEITQAGTQNVRGSVVSEKVSGETRKTARSRPVSRRAWFGANGWKTRHSAEFRPIARTEKKSIRPAAPSGQACSSGSGVGECDTALPLPQRRGDEACTGGSRFNPHKRPPRGVKLRTSTCRIWGSGDQGAGGEISRRDRGCALDFR